MPQEIIVVKTPKGCRVLPPCPIVAKGDTIAWRNCTRGDIQVLLPDVFKVKKGGAEKGGELTVNVLEDCPAGFYPYAVYSAEANDMAVGDSAPGVIIK